ncbi:MAG TPA: DUF427 domain-containing protein [Capillimicrobium sp.]|jgi:uncharacterized protein (DUF427 family)
MESVWDYPRPPALAPCERRARIELGGTVIADSERALRVLETSHPPTLYLPLEDIAPGALTPADRARATVCEFKGVARYLDVRGGDGRVAPAAAWTYPAPRAAYAALQGCVAFYPGAMDACWLGDERVQAQEGDFYGGWVTADLRGPFKGGPGTTGW